jgi:hypothetical protein
MYPGPIGVRMPSLCIGKRLATPRGPAQIEVPGNVSVSGSLPLSDMLLVNSDLTQVLPAP